MIKDLITENRTCRSFDRGRVVTEEELRYMIDCARLSASSVNKQPLKYGIILDSRTCDLVSSEIRFGAMLPDVKLPPKGKEPASYILICQDARISKSKSAFQIDVGIAAQSITLAATELGLAACIVGNFDHQMIENTLRMEEEFTVKLVIAIGKAAEERKIVEIDEGQSTNYYRTEENVHCVPKRKLDDVIIDRNYKALENKREKLW